MAHRRGAAPRIAWQAGRCGRGRRRLGSADLIVQRVAGEPRHVEMAEAVRADLEIQIGEQLRGCNDAHMKQMDQIIADMTDAAKKKEAIEALDQSKAAMKAGNTAQCMKYMDEAHKVMGL
jgi:hypothetical protein